MYSECSLYNPGTKALFERTSTCLQRPGLIFSGVPKAKNKHSIKGTKTCIKRYVVPFSPNVWLALELKQLAEECI